MKRKIFSVLFILMLALSFSLLTTVPAAAVAPTLYEGWSADFDGQDTTAAWSHLAQTFTAESNHTVSMVKLALARDGSPGLVTASIRATDGEGNPTGPDLTSGSIDGNSLSGTALREIAFSAPYNLFDGQKYAIVVTNAVAPNADNYIGWRSDSNTVYTGGEIKRSTDGNTWSHGSADCDFLFEVWGNPITEVWVSNAGNDDNPGTEAAPFATIQRGIDVVSGGTVHVAAGTYDLTAPIVVNKSVILTGDTSNCTNVKINAPAGIPDNDCFQVKANDVTIQGFTMSGAYDSDAYDQNAAVMIGTHWSGAPMIGLDNITISYNDIYDCTRGIYVYRATNVTINNNKIHDIVISGAHASDMWPGKAIELRGDGSPAETQCHNIDILDNQIYNCQLLGIEVNLWEMTPDDTFVDVDVLIEGNTIYNNGGNWAAVYGSDVYVYRGISCNGQTRNVTIRDNEIYGHTSDTNAPDFRSGAIRIDEEKEYTITGNHLHDNYKGIRISTSGSGFVVNSNDFENNTIQVDDSAGALDIGAALQSNNFDRAVTVDHGGLLLHTIWSKIQPGIDAAVGGDTVNVAAGTYPEILNLLDKGLTIDGAGVDATIVDASSKTGYAVQNFGNSTTIKDLTLIGTSSGSSSYGFKVSHVSNITIDNVKVENSYKTAFDLNTVTGANLNNIEAVDTISGFGLMILDSTGVNVNNVSTSGNAWGGVTVQTKDAPTDLVNFTGTFDVQEDAPLLLEKDPDPDDGTYYPITNVAIPSEFTHIVYAFREGDNYKQTYYQETADSAKVLAHSLIDSTFAYSGMLIYDLAEENYYVIDGMLIQDAITAATPGDTIDVEAGNYDEQVIIDEDLTLQGDGDATVIKPSSAGILTQHLTIPWAGGTTEVAGAIMVNSANATVKDLAVDGVNVTAAPAGANWVAGILYSEAGGTIDNVTVANLTIGATGTGVRGQGILSSAVTNEVNVEVMNSRVSNYDKNGITAIGATLTANIHHNEVVGRGPLPEGDEVQNGILIIQDAAGTVNDNMVSNHAYIPGEWGACGILFCNASGSAQGNTSTNNQMGIVAQIIEGFGGSMQTVAFNENTVDAKGIDVPVISGLNAATYVADASLTVTIDDNDLTGGAGDGISIGDLEELGAAGTISFDINNNTIANWNIGFELLSVPGDESTGGHNVFENNDIQVLDRVQVIDVEATLANNTFDRAVTVDHPGDSLLHTIWSKIQEGINAAVDGDTVNVAAGTYTEAVTINKSLTLRGATWDVNKNGYTVPEDYAWDDTVESIITYPDPGSSHSAIVDIVDTDNVTFEGFIVQELNAVGNNGDSLLRVYAHTQAISNIIVRNNVIGPFTNITSQDGTHGRMGLYIVNHPYSDQYGVVNSTFAGNKIFDCKGNGNNVFIWSSYEQYGALGPASMDGTVIEDNEIYGSHRSGIETAGGYTGLTIQNNKIYNNGGTFEADANNLKYGHGIVLIRGSSDSHSDSIPGFGPEDLMINNNEIYGNQKSGIYMGPISKKYTITGNKIYNNGWDGMRLDLAESYNNPDFEEGDRIPWADQTEDIAAQFNNIYDNGGYGVQVIGSPTNDFVLDATNNWWGTNKEPSGISGNVTYGPWLVIGISANPVSIEANGASTSTITADMTKNSDGEDTSSSGHIADGTLIKFSTNKGAIHNPDNIGTVNGTATVILTSSANMETATVTASAPPYNPDSTATIAVLFIKSGGGGGGGGTPTINTNLFGTAGSFNTNSSGVIQAEIKATSEDGKLTIDIPKGTKALDKYGNPLYNMTAEAFINPPPPPANTNIIGLTYDFGPAGATFDPPITFTWNYDPAALPAGVAEKDLVIAYYDATAGKWVELQCMVDTVNNKITASVSHYTTFTMLGTVAPTPTAPPTTTPPTTTPPTTTPPTTTPPTKTPPVTTPPATTPPATTPPTTTPPATTPADEPNQAVWWYIIGVAIVIVIGVIIFLVRRKKRD